MMSKRIKRPSPAMVIAITALITALSGTAIAGGVLNKKKVKKIATNVANKQIESRAPGLSVARAISADSASNATSADHATSANTASNATSADHATSANTATSANPVAFAHVATDGTVDAGRSKNITSANVSSEGSGLYCFRGLGFAFTGAQVTTDYDDSFGTFSPQFGEQVPSTCTPDAQAYVLMLEKDAGPTDAGFFIVFYG